MAGPCQLLSQVCSSSVVLGCALELWPAVAWPIHATKSTGCALLLLFRLAACAVILWLAVTGPVHASCSARYALLLLCAAVLWSFELQ